MGPGSPLAPGKPIAPGWPMGPTFPGCPGSPGSPFSPLAASTRPGGPRKEKKESLWSQPSPTCLQRDHRQGNMCWVWVSGDPCPTDVTDLAVIPLLLQVPLGTPSPPPDLKELVEMRCFPRTICLSLSLLLAFTRQCFTHLQPLPYLAHPLGRSPHPCHRCQAVLAIRGCLGRCRRSCRVWHRQAALQPGRSAWPTWSTSVGAWNGVGGFPEWWEGWRRHSVLL